MQNDNYSQNSTESHTNYFILKIIISLLIVIALVVTLFFAFKNYERRVQTSKENPIIEYVPPSPKRPSDIELVSKIEQSILSYYNVPEFEDIGYNEPDNILSELQRIEPTNPGADDGEFTLHFIAHPYANELSQASLLNAARNAVIATYESVPELTGITAPSEVFNFQTNSVAGVYYSAHFAVTEL